MDRVGHDSDHDSDQREREGGREREREREREDSDQRTATQTTNSAAPHGEGHAGGAGGVLDEGSDGEKLSEVSVGNRKKEY